LRMPTEKIVCSFINNNLFPPPLQGLPVHIPAGLFAYLDAD
jgi:hypothetical protein